MLEEVCYFERCIGLQNLSERFRSEFYTKLFGEAYALQNFKQMLSK